MKSWLIVVLVLASFPASAQSNADALQKGLAVTGALPPVPNSQDDARAAMAEVQTQIAALSARLIESAVQISRLRAALAEARKPAPGTSEKNP